MNGLRQEFVVLARMSLPVAMTQVGLMLTGVVDTMMVSRVDVASLAGSGVANSWQWCWMSIGLGVVMGMDPVISQAHGRGDGARAGLTLQRGVVTAALVSVPICVALALTEPGLLLLGQDPHVARLAADYNWYKLPTVPCFLLYSALRQYLQGRALMAPATWVMWLGNAVNVVANWALIFGHLGAPALGLRGAAIASSLTGLFLVVGLVAWVRGFRLHAHAWQPWSRAAFDVAGLTQIAKLGIPVGMQMALESWAFAGGTFMAGWISVIAVGSHQIVLNMAALTFMVPLGIAQGASARIGNLIGERDAVGMRRATVVALALGAGVMLVSAAGFVTLRDRLPRLFTDEPEVIALAATILPFAAAFQLFDGTQVVAGGLLRGMGRPAAPALVNLIGYYALALPVAYYFAFVRGLGLVGIWGALALGLVAVATALAFWVRRTARLPLDALTV